MKKNYFNPLPKHIPQKLYDAYVLAEYIVEKPFFLEIKVNQNNHQFNDYLNKNNYTSWGFITAWNPYSKELPLTENKKRNQELLKELEEQNYTYLDGEGRGDNWSEKSFLVFDISKKDIIQLAKKHQQNAVLFGNINEEAQLVFCIE